MKRHAAAVARRRPCRAHSHRQFPANPVEPLESRTLFDGLPAWVAPTTGATWNNTTKVLDVTGSATIVADASADAPTVNVDGSGAVLTIDPQSVNAVHVEELNITNGAKVEIDSPTATPTPRVLMIDGSDALSIDSASTLDIEDNALIVNDSSYASIQPLIDSGFNGGAWNGVGISSSTAGAEPNGLTAIGYAANADFGATSFEGVGGLDGDEMLLKYTWYGDADLDGKVTPDDYSQFLNGYQTQSAATNNWLNG
jgi:hypothetical protein